MPDPRREAQGAIQHILLNATGNKKPIQQEVGMAFAFGGDSEMRRQLHAATFIASLWGGRRRLIVNYYDHLQGKAELQKCGPTDPLRSHWDRIATFNKEKAGQYHKYVLGMQAWQAEYNREMFHPLDLEGMDIKDPEVLEVPPLKLDYVRLAGIIERTDELEHPAIRAAAHVATKHPDEYCRDAFQFGGHLLRFVIDAPLVQPQ